MASGRGTGCSAGARIHTAGTPSGLPGDPRDEQGRWLGAAVHGVLVAGLYLSDGTPQPGPKFDGKLRWRQRLIRHASTLIDQPHPVAMPGDVNVVPTDTEVCDPRAWRDDALLQPTVRAAWTRLLDHCPRTCSDARNAARASAPPPLPFRFRRLACSQRQTEAVIMQAGMPTDCQGRRPLGA